MGETEGRPPRRSTVAWVLYDLANTIFSFNILSVYFPLWLSEDLGQPDSVFAIGNSLSMAVILLVAPTLGALSDRARRRIPFLVASTVFCVLSTLLLGIDGWPVAIGFFVLANIGFQAGLIFYDSLLPIVSTPATRGRVGAWGVGIGYIGSFVGLGLGSVILSLHPKADSIVFVATAAFFLLISLPAFFFIREPHRRATRFSLATLVQITRSSFHNLFRVLRGRDVPHVGRFLVGRIFYTDAANTMIIFMAIYAVNEVGFSEGAVGLVLALGIAGAALLAPLWGVLVDRAGPKHTLDVVLLVWMFGLTIVLLIPLLGLPKEVFYLVAFLLGGALGGTWSADRPLMLGLVPSHRVGEFYGLYAMVGRFAAIFGPLVWALFVDGLGWGRPAAVASLVAFMVLAFAILRGVPDPTRAGPSLLAPYLPWRSNEGYAAPLPQRWALRFPATLTYLVVTTLLFFLALHWYRRGNDFVIDLDQVPDILEWTFVYEIAQLFADPVRTFVNFAAGVWVNYHYIQLIYVWVLLLLFGVWFELREGPLRTAIVFYVTSIIAGLFAGILLHVLRATMDAAWIEDTWDRAWTGGSAGAFGLMGALAARARRPWLLLLIFAAWEINVGFWYLRSYTPAFHLSALAAGYAIARWKLPPRPLPYRTAPVSRKALPPSQRPASRANNPDSRSGASEG